MDRRKDLVRFYSLLDRLQDKVGGKRILGDCSGYMSWPDRGLYFFFEESEARSDTGKGMRVVRVGTHALKDSSRSTLWQRLKAHRGTNSSGGGNHRGSIFRLLVGTALAGRQPEFAVPTWDNRKSSDSAARPGELPLEVRVSEIIRAMPILWLEIDDEPGPNSRRSYIERNSIALLSNYDCQALDAPTQNWLGQHCSRELVRESGLWNQDYVRESYDPAFLDEFETLIKPRGTTTAQQTHAQRIVGLLHQRPGLDDDEIATTLGIEPRQTVNQVCNRLAKSSVIRRERGLSGKIVNRLIGDHASSTVTALHQPRPVPHKAPERKRLPSRSLVPKNFEKTLVVIPCCKAKQNHTSIGEKGPSIIDDLPDPLAEELQQARNSVIEKAKIDETTLVPAWHRYDGSLYKEHGRRAVGELMNAGAAVLVLSGGYGLLLAAEPIGMYEGVLRPAWWPDQILQRCLIAYAKGNELASVRAFASATSSYRKILERVKWREAGIDDAMLLTPQVVPGGVRKSPATIGEALMAFHDGTLTTGWQSSYGLYLDVHEY